MNLYDGVCENAYWILRLAVKDCKFQEVIFYFRVELGSRKKSIFYVML